MKFDPFLILYEELRKALSIVAGYYSDEYVVKYTELLTPWSELFQWDCFNAVLPRSKCESVFSNLAVTTAHRQNE